MSDLSAVTSRLPRTTLMTTIHVDGRPFRCSTDMAEHCLSVFRGEYDPGPVELPEQPVVLDIGANYGSFAVWAANRWRGAQIMAFEPNPETFETLEENWAVSGPHLIRLSSYAVRATAGKAFLRFGKNNAGEASFHDLGEQREDGVEVECIAASTLPDCDVLKVDTEGCEVEILDAYNADRWETRPVSVLLEFHSEHDRKRIDDRMRGRDYSLTRGTIRSADRGVLCYVRRA